MRLFASLAAVVTCVLLNPAPPRVEAGLTILRPDLRVVSCQHIPYKSNWMRIVIANYGPGSAGPCILWTSAHTDGMFWKFTDVPALPGYMGLYVPKVTLDVPIGTSLSLPGDYVRCHVDYNDQISETNEGNNVLIHVEL